jgi:hypothetical protein
MLLVLCVFSAVGLSAEDGQVDFSGKWYLQKDRSEPSDISDRFVPAKIVAAQQGLELLLEKSYSTFAVYESLTLDGEEFHSEHRQSPRSTTATWDESGTVLTVDIRVVFRQNFEVRTHEVWRLQDGGAALALEFSSETVPLSADDVVPEWISSRGKTEASLVYTQQEPTGPREYIPPNHNFYMLNPYPKPLSLGSAQERVEENLGRGMVATHAEEGSVYVGWRLLKDDPQEIAFNLYRSTSGADPIKLNDQPLLTTTDFVDLKAPLDKPNSWWVKPVLNGEELQASGRAELPANPPAQQYTSIKLRDDIEGNGIHKIGIGDLDGDGEYDFVVKRPGGRVDPGRARRSPDTFKVEGYTSDGTWLWRNELGWSIEQGTWTSPMIVYDFNGDGKAEVAIKTGEGDHREENGRVLSGPEYCSIWNGETGAEMAKVDWIARGKPGDWGDDVGNRMNRNMMGVAYLDGKTPSLLVIRGIYGLMKVDAWFMQDGEMQRAWRWTNETAGWRYQGQGQHSIHVVDIDGDGFDEILNGSVAIDNDGRLMWSTGMGHGDRFYVTDIDPDRPGLEVWYTYEDPHPRNGVGLWDARTGNIIFGTDDETIDNEIDRGLVGDIDPAYPGMEVWADRFYFTAKGETIEGDIPPLDGLVWWDADLLREIQSRERVPREQRRQGRRGQAYVSKWQGDVLTSGIEGSVMIWADLVGDWREEILTYTDGELRLYTTVIPATDRRVTLMQDPLYRSDVALKAMGYDQVPMTSYYLGE